MRSGKESAAVSEARLRKKTKASRRGDNRALIMLVSAATVLAFLVVWQLIPATGLLRGDQLPLASDVIARLCVILIEPETWSVIGVTLAIAGVGFLVSVFLGIVVGVALGLNDFARRSTIVILEAFKSVPAIAVLPLAILTLGSTPSMSVFLIFFAGFWPLVIQVIYGVRAIDPTVFDTAKALGVGRLRLFAQIILPSASPYIAAGLRVASASALSLTVIAQMVGGAPGIGREILLAQNGGIEMLPTMFTYIVIAGGIGTAAMAMIGVLEKRLMFWHESQQAMVRAGKEAP